MKISVLIPYRSKTDHWRRVFARTQLEWERLVGASGDLDVEVVVGEQTWDGPMHVARCINEAAARATGDVFALWGADHWPDATTLRWLDEMMESDAHPWLPMFECTGVMTYGATKSVLRGAHIDDVDQTWQDHVPLCIGIFAMRREAFFEVGGEDERFIGWGMEDAALRHTMTAFYGESPRPPGGSTLRALWHPVQPHDDAPAMSNIRIYHEEYLAPGLSRDALAPTLERARAVRVGY